MTLIKFFHVLIRTDFWGSYFTIPTDVLGSDSFLAWEVIANLSHFFKKRFTNIAIHYKYINTL